MLGWIGEANNNSQWLSVARAASLHVAVLAQCSIHASRLLCSVGHCHNSLPCRISNLPASRPSQGLAVSPSVCHWFQGRCPHLAEVYCRILVLIHLADHSSALARQFWEGARAAVRQ